MASLDTNATEILELASKTELLKLLECPVCSEIPFPPIYNCLKGHVICHTCRVRLTNCVLCKCAYSDGRNFVAESIVTSAKHFCKYKNEGCSLILTGDLMMEHRDNCPYRPIKCQRKHTDTCKNSTVLFSKYLKHLKEGHKFKQIEIENENEKNDSTLANSVYLSEFSTIDLFPVSVEDFTWGNNFYVCANDYIFLPRSFMKSSICYLSLALIGPELEAENFIAQVKIYSVKSKLTNMQWTFPVHSIRLIEDEIVEKGLCCPIPSKYMMAMCTQEYVEMEEDKYFYFTAFYSLKLKPQDQE